MTSYSERFTVEGLEKEWKSLQIIFARDTKKMYQKSVRRGNKQTFEEFQAEVKKDWMADMKKKRGIK